MYHNEKLDEWCRKITPTSYVILQLRILCNNLICSSTSWCVQNSALSFNDIYYNYSTLQCMTVYTSKVAWMSHMKWIIWQWIICSSVGSTFMNQQTALCSSCKKACGQEDPRQNFTDYTFFLYIQSCFLTPGFTSCTEDDLCIEVEIFAVNTCIRLV